VKFHYRATEKFWASFYRLSNSQKESCRRAWQVFKENPFDPRLRTHKIHRLSACYGRIVYAVVIEEDLRLLFYIDGQTVTSLIVGNHGVNEN
jgi:hypothetical protein